MIGKGTRALPCTKFALGEFPMMPAHQRYSWTKNTIGIGQPNLVPAPPLQHDQLLSEHRDFSLEPRLRSERRDQDGQNEAEEPDHPTSLSDSLSSSME
jgi:hypothetical protein